MISDWYAKHRVAIKLFFVWIFFVALSLGFFFLVMYLGKTVSWIEIVFIIFTLIILAFLLWQVCKTDNDLLHQEKEFRKRFF